MGRPVRTGVAMAAVFSVAGLALAANPGLIAAQQRAAPSAPMSRGSVDLGSALDADGTFRGAPGVVGSVDTSAWSLVSDLTSGAPPRFAPAASRVSPSTTPIGPWSALGSNGSGGGALNGTVAALVVSGSDLYVGGTFTNAGDVATADNIAKWNGTSWSGLGSNGSGDGAIQGPVDAIAVSGSDVYVGGTFTDAAGIANADSIAKFDGTTWSELPETDGGPAMDPGSIVSAIAISGANVYIAGLFQNAGGEFYGDNLARWDGSAWYPVGCNCALFQGALGAHVWALAVSGSDLYAGGDFANAAGLPTTDYVAEWDGTFWSGLGSNGSGDGALNGSVKALAVSGSSVYVGGTFTDAAGVATADNIAKWNGTTWSGLGSNGAGDGAISSGGESVSAIALSGSEVYVGGGFEDAAGNHEADAIAEFRGGSWLNLGSNGAGQGPFGGPGSGGVYALATSPSGLYAGGSFTNAAGIAKADDVAEWSLVTAAVTHQPDGRIRLGTGPYVGNDIYNTTGVGQTTTGSAVKGQTITFGISVQNDGNASDRFTLKATGTASGGYTVKYFKGTTDITASVVAGSYQTAALARGATDLITATVKVMSSAASGSKVTRLVTITSVAKNSKRDAVKFVGKRT